MNKQSEAGFSYIDVMIAVVILLVGILALLSAITGAIIQAKGQEHQLSAKQTATSTIESIMSVKETDPTRLGWIAVGNVGSNPDENNDPRGIFLTGFQPVKPDAGPDQIIGTADDTGDDLAGFQRQIVITDECDPDRPSYNCQPAGTSPVRIRTIEVTVVYSVGTIQRQERVTTVLTDYAVQNE